MRKVILFLFFTFGFGQLFSQETDSSASTFSGKLYLTLKPKEKLKLDTIIVSGNKITKDFIILKELSFKRNDSITIELLEFNKNRIYGTGLFNKIEESLFIQNGKTSLELRVYERWYLFPYPIIGFKDRDWSNFYYGLGLAHINFLGLNQKIFGSFALGYDPWANFHYVNPNFITEDFMFDISLSHSKTKNKSLFNSTEVKNFYEYWYGAQLSVGNRIDIYRSLWLSFGYNQIKVDDRTINKTISPNGRDEFLSINLSGEINTRDINEYPMRGEYLSAALKKCGIGESDVDYLQIWIDARKYLPVIYNWSLGFRGFSGFTVGNTLPNYSHYFIGYSERIRGKFTKILEGENITGFSSELRIPLFGPTYYVIPDFPVPQFAILRYGLNLALFFDAGQVWDKHSFKWNDFIYGYGFGLNFLLPYGVILRTELGFDEHFKSEFIFDAGVSF